MADMQGEKGGLVPPIPEQPQPLVSFIEDREARLGAINTFLGERKLRPLHGVGNWQEPLIGTELTDIRATYTRPERFYTVVTFGARFPNPNYDSNSEDPKKKLPYTEGEYNLIFKANGAVADGSVYVTRIKTEDGQKVYVLANQYRIAKDERMLEFPRGFASTEDIEALGEQHDKPIDLAKLTGVKALRELAQETGIKRIKGFTHLGKVAEDSSTHASDVNVYLVDADSDMSQQELDLSETGLAVVVQSGDEFYGALQEGKIHDMHSLAAFMKTIVHDPEEARALAEFLVGKDVATTEHNVETQEPASTKAAYEAEITALKRQLADLRTGHQEFEDSYMQFANILQNAGQYITDKLQRSKLAQFKAWTTLGGGRKRLVRQDGSETGLYIGFPPLKGKLPFVGVRAIGKLNMRMGIYVKDEFAPGERRFVGDTEQLAYLLSQRNISPENLPLFLDIMQKESGVKLPEELLSDVMGREKRVDFSEQEAKAVQDA